MQKQKTHISKLVLVMLFGVSLGVMGCAASLSNFAVPEEVPVSQQEATSEDQMVLSAEDSFVFAPIEDISASDRLSSTIVLVPANVVTTSIDSPVDSIAILLESDLSADQLQDAWGAVPVDSSTAISIAVLDIRPNQPLAISDPVFLRAFTTTLNSEFQGFTLYDPSDLSDFEGNDLVVTPYICPPKSDCVDDVCQACIHCTGRLCNLICIFCPQQSEQ